MPSGDFKNLLNETKGLNVTTANRFNNYSPEFDYSAMSSILDKLNSLQTNKGMKAMGGLLDKNKRSTRASLASSGITGGSIMNNLMSEAEAKVGSQMSDFLSNMGESRLNAEIPLMTTANNEKFRATSAASNVDQANVGNNLKKTGLMSNILSGYEQAKQYEDSQPTFWDDLMGIINVGANVGKAAAGLGWI